MDTKKLKILTFSGKKEDWHMWSRKFMFKLTIYGAKNLLKDHDGTKENDSLDLARDQEDNALVYSDLLLSQEDEVCFSIVDLELTDQYPNGCVHCAFKRLKSLRVQVKKQDMK